MLFPSKRHVIIRRKRGTTMKIKNLYIADANYLNKLYIVKKPTLFKRILAFYLDAEITRYKEVFTNSNIGVMPKDLYPLCVYINVKKYKKTIRKKQLGKIKLKSLFESAEGNKTKIGFE